jgi:hypothetical protein
LREAKKLLDRLEEHKAEIHVCKGHFGSKKERNLLLSYKNIKLFLIWRDIRDVLVSQYFYEINKFRKTFKDFSDYYWKYGRSLLCYHIAYKKVWDSVSDDPRVFSSSFSELTNDFTKSAGELLSFSGLDGIEMSALAENISLEQLRTKHNDEKGIFFRKGIIGEHREIIKSAKVYRDIDYITNLRSIHFNVFSYKTKVQSVVKTLRQAFPR